MAQLQAAIDRANNGGAPISILQYGDSHVVAGTEPKAIEDALKSLGPVQYDTMAKVGISANYPLTDPTNWLDKPIQKDHPDLIILSFGSNDSAGPQNQAAYEASYQKLIDNVRERAPNASTDPTNVSTLLPIPYQGNFTQQIVGQNNGNQGRFVIQTYVAYSFVDGNGVTNYGVSVVPTQTAQIVTNQGLKGKSASAYVVGDTNLAGLRDAGLLFNYIGSAPDNNSKTFVLLGVGQGVFGSSGAIADVQLNAPTLNQSALPNSTSTLLYPPVSGGTNSPVAKDTVNGANLNCSTFIVVPLR